jgi:hypothetical protein
LPKGFARRSARAIREKKKTKNEKKEVSIFFMPIELWLLIWQKQHLKQMILT